MNYTAVILYMDIPLNKLSYIVYREWEQWHFVCK